MMKKLILAIALLGALATNAAHTAAGPTPATADYVLSLYYNLSTKEQMFIQQTICDEGESLHHLAPSPSKPTQAPQPKPVILPQLTTLPTGQPPFMDPQPVKQQTLVPPPVVPQPTRWQKSRKQPPESRKLPLGLPTGPPAFEQTRKLKKPTPVKPSSLEELPTGAPASGA